MHAMAPLTPNYSNTVQSLLINYNFFFQQNCKHDVISSVVSSLNKCDCCSGPYSAFKWVGVRCKGKYFVLKIQRFLLQYFTTETLKLCNLDILNVSLNWLEKAGLKKADISFFLSPSICLSNCIYTYFSVSP